MRTYFLLFFIFSIGLNGQNIVTSTRSTVSALVTINNLNPKKGGFEKKVYMYKTFDDFQSNNGEYVGDFSATKWNDWGSNKIYVEKNSVETKINLNKYWGFKIDEYTFRMNENSPGIPLTVVNQKGFTFYCDGYIYLYMIQFNKNDGVSSRTKTPLFYSKTINSKVFEITKIIKNEENNPELSSLIKCIKKGRERIGGYQAQFNSYYDCVINF